MYRLWVIRTVELSRQAKKDLSTVPDHVVIKFQVWVTRVEELGLEEVRKGHGYHDEPLKGSLRGFRSIRLTRAYRAYYRIVEDKAEFVRVERVDKHVY